MIEGVGLFLAGLIGGMVNAIAGGGSFITFPALMAAGVSPIAANATNTFASSAGYLSGAAGFRRELWAHRRQLPKIAVSALVGGGLGAWLLLQIPENTFSRAIPWLLLLATVLLVWGILCKRLYGTAVRTSNPSRRWAVRCSYCCCFWFAPTADFSMPAWASSCSATLRWRVIRISI